MTGGQLPYWAEGSTVVSRTGERRSIACAMELRAVFMASAQEATKVGHHTTADAMLRLAHTLREALNDARAYRFPANDTSRLTPAEAQEVVRGMLEASIIHETFGRAI